MRMRCIQCKQVETKIQVLVPGRSSKATYFVNDKKQRWQGRTCPSCRLGAILAERRLRTKEMIEVTKSKQRPCRACGKATLNYFKCDPCKGYYEFEHLDHTDLSHFHPPVSNRGAGWRY